MTLELRTLPLPTAAAPDALRRGTQQQRSWTQQPRSAAATDGRSEKGRQELLWELFFRDPTQWRDYRAEKTNSRYPDFRHRTSKEPLWLNNRRRPEWVDSELARWDASAEGWQGGGSPEVAALSKRCLDGELPDAVEGLDLLVQEGCPVRAALFCRILKLCVKHKDLSAGMRVHALAVKSGLEENAFLATHLVGMYAALGSLGDAAQAFSKVGCPDAHLWCSIILAHARHGRPREAVELYRQMRESGVKPDNHVFVSVLKACAAAADLVSGKEVHADILASEGKVNVFVGNSLVNMYAKCGSLEDARRVFDELPSRDVVSWNAMIAGYEQHGLGREALALYVRMQKEGMTPASLVTFVCLLQACSSLGALQTGKQLHEQIRARGMEADVTIASCLVDMYAKSGSLEDARTVFHSLPTKSVVTWNAMLNGFAENSNAQMAVQCFEDMRELGVRPDEATFSSLLVACTHAGLVDEGRQYFRMMVEEYRIAATDYHHNCMIYLLGQSGRLDEAEHILQTAPLDSHVVGWKSLLTACKTHGDIDRGRRCFDQLVALEPENSTPYVLLGNMFANAGRWKDVDALESLRKSVGAWKKPAKACIEVKDEVHEFTVGEERSDISSKVKSVSMRLKQEGGHVPQTALVLTDMSERKKEDALCGHAEKLALAYGLLNTPDGTTLVVTKNLRMCNDCHSSTKIMSSLEHREIVVRDSHRVHRFQDGSCSCGDKH